MMRRLRQWAPALVDVKKMAYFLSFLSGLVAGLVVAGVVMSQEDMRGSSLAPPMPHVGPSNAAVFLWVDAPTAKAACREADEPATAAAAAAATSAEAVLWRSLWPRPIAATTNYSTVGSLTAVPPAGRNLSSDGRCAVFDWLRLPLIGPRAARAVAAPRYVVIERKGGLGNQLFEVVHGVVEALAHGRTPLLGPPLENPHATEPYEGTIFRHICHMPATDITINATVVNNYGSLCAYAPLQLSDEQVTVQLAGHWQHWRFAAELPPAALRALFAPPPRLLQRLEATYGPLAECVAVHVRRGDLVLYNDSIGMDAYIEPALRELESRGPPLTCLLIVSDDITWTQTQANFISRGARFVTGENELASLYLLASVGRGLICPTSTFCWWGAFLGREDNGRLARNKNVVMPRPWTMSSSSRSYRDSQHEQYFFPGVTTVPRTDFKPPSTY